MNLTNLQPKFLKRDDDTHHHRVESLDEADGILFLCPKCLVENGMDSAGVHSIICWEPSVPQTTNPTPGRWDMQGTGFDDLSLVASSSSILLTGEGCQAHFFIQNGKIV